MTEFLAVQLSRCRTSSVGCVYASPLWPSVLWRPLAVPDLPLASCHSGGCCGTQATSLRATASTASARARSVMEPSRGRWRSGEIEARLPREW